jgi:hypothetical protein
LLVIPAQADGFEVVLPLLAIPAQAGIHVALAEIAMGLGFAFIHLVMPGEFSIPRHAARSGVLPCSLQASTQRTFELPS